MKKIIIANWKMNMTYFKIKEFFDQLEFKFNDLDLVILPSYIGIFSARILSKQNSQISFGVQDLNYVETGDFNGSVSWLEVKEIGLDYGLINHWENIYLDPDMKAKEINSKLKIMLENKMKPILFLGESLKDNFENFELLIENEIRKYFDDITEEKLFNATIIYQPLCVVNNLQMPSNEELVQQIEVILGILRKIYGDYLSDNINILYGTQTFKRSFKELMETAKIKGIYIDRGSDVDLVNYILNEVGKEAINDEKQKAFVD